MKGNMTNPKRIVIIEGDAFDADAVLAITKADTKSFKLMIDSEIYAPLVYGFSDERTRNHAMALAIEAWRSVVDYPPVVEPLPPFEPQPNEEVEDFTLHWRDEKGRYYETYDGNRIWTGTKTGRFVWNEGPPRRKNPMGPGASPISKVYVDDAGKPLDPQPI